MDRAQKQAEFQMSFRDNVLKSMDETCSEFGLSNVTDSDLPELFRSIDSLAEKIFLRDFR